MKPFDPQHLGTRMRAGRKNWGKHHRVGPVFVCIGQFAVVMRCGDPAEGGGRNAIERAVNAVRAPFLGGIPIVRDNRPVPVFAQLGQERGKACRAFGLLQVLMTEDEARSLWQPGKRLLEHGIIALIRKKPEVRQGL